MEKLKVVKWNYITKGVHFLHTPINQSKTHVVFHYTNGVSKYPKTIPYGDPSNGHPRGNIKAM